MASSSPPLDRSLLILAESLAGEFDNKSQSLADPAWFLHLRVWNRPLPSHVFTTGYGFFIEQVNVATGNPPYRQRVLHLMSKGGHLQGQYYALKNPQALAGGALAPERLQPLQRDDLIDLPTCALTITLDSVTGKYQGRLPADTLCSITIDGKTSYISLAFDIGPGYDPNSSEVNGSVELIVYDRGVDKATGATTWGPRMGPFRLTKTQPFSPQFCP
jgi:hypothetical protein